MNQSSNADLATVIESSLGLSRMSPQSLYQVSRHAFITESTIVIEVRMLVNLESILFQLLEEIPNFDQVNGNQETSDQVVPQSVRTQPATSTGKGKNMMNQESVVRVTHHQLPRDQDPVQGAQGLAAQGLAPPPPGPPLLQGSQVTSSQEERPWIAAQVS